jgi:two-component system LytT family response regulator
MSRNGEIRVLVADDEPLARRGVRQLLAPHRDMTVVGEARNGAETLRELLLIRLFQQATMACG